MKRYIPTAGVNYGEDTTLAGSASSFNEILVLNNIFGKFLESHTQDGDLSFTLGDGNVIGATLYLKIISNGINTIFFSDDFDYIYGFQNGSTLEAGSYEIFFLYKANGKVSVNIPAGDGTSSSGGLIILTSPENFTATGTAEDTITLTWDLVDNASSYLIQSSPDNATWSTLTSPSSVTSEYVHSGLGATQTVYYRFKAIGDGLVYSDSAYVSDSGTTTSAVNELTWSTFDNMIVSGNDLTSTSDSGTAQATEKLVGDGYVEFKIDASPVNSTGTVLALDELSGGSPWTVNEFAIYIYNGDVYSGLEGVSASLAAVFGNELIRLHRVGTEMRWYRVTSGVPELLKTVTGVTTADLFIKAYIVVSGKSMYDCILQNT